MFLEETEHGDQVVTNVGSVPSVLVHVQDGIYSDSSKLFEISKNGLARPGIQRGGIFVGEK